MSCALLALLLGFWGAVPVDEKLQGDDAVTGGGDDVGEGHQRVSSFLQEGNMAQDDSP